MARLRLTFGLPWRLSVTLSWIPPIRINGVAPNVLSMSLGRPFRLSRNLVIGGALIGQVGATTGDYTCPESAANAGADRVANPYGCEQSSHDRVSLNYVAGELSASYRIEPAHGLEPYTSVGISGMFLAFQVDARYAGTIDHTRLETAGSTAWLTGGLLYPATRRLDLGTELFYSPLVVARPNQPSVIEGLFNVRALVAYRFY
jgi:hypothetical protein